MGMTLFKNNSNSTEVLLTKCVPENKSFEFSENSKLSFSGTQSVEFKCNVMCTPIARIFPNQLHSHCCVLQKWYHNRNCIKIYAQIWREFLTQNKSSRNRFLFAFAKTITLYNLHDMQWTKNFSCSCGKELIRVNIMSGALRVTNIMSGALRVTNIVSGALRVTNIMSGALRVTNTVLLSNHQTSIICCYRMVQIHAVITRGSSPSYPMDWHNN